MVVGEQNANVHRVTTTGSTDSWDIDLDDPQIVELYRRNLFDRDGNFGIGANVTRRQAARRKTGDDK